MGLLTDAERPVVEGLAALSFANPFLPERVEQERRVLGDRFVGRELVWHPGDDPDQGSPNVPLLAIVAEELLADLGRRLSALRPADPEELALYRDVVFYVLYQRYEARLLERIVRAQPTAGGAGGSVAGGTVAGDGRRSRSAAVRSFRFYDRFAADRDELLEPLERRLSTRPELRSDPGLDLPAAPHLFACFFQLRRAFHFIFRHLLGGSLPAARLRAAVWQSIFTRDLRRYQRSLYRRMGDLTTLITGPSGTGKELVARAIGLARFIPFDPESRTFAEEFPGSFFALDLSALSPTLIESELFGHRRGAFTGAVEDRAGWLELCPPLGTIFLDEIGELDPALQVKLLRVLESRSFQRLGESRSRPFAGKVVAATNRRLQKEIDAGRFRLDLYYRLCGDTIRTPSLADRIAGDPRELADLTRFLAAEIAGPAEAPELTEEVLSWIGEELGGGYPWPGNIRELGQCVRNVMVRGEYRPAAPAAADPIRQLADRMMTGELTADRLLAHYTTLVYHQAGSYQEAARRLEIDRRTVKARLDRELLAQLSSG